ncbi:transcription factor IIIB 70 kDa subunit-like isoform X2 [Rosa rugosa]|uniref:transcription factor IIIB 70 kDa subunit-like isoform X2 n=1 Tax=Rosa rugosa TaxID=74645 RepID=UPI002B40E6A9|nr:transcription factor IIIB 70 kDa subunit-like isoform X2 [Rosa rugosa]
MVFCNNCGKSVPGTEDSGRIWCDLCGKVLVYDIYSEEPTFFKDAAGQSKLAGNFVRGFQSEVSASRERLIDNARYELRCLRNGLDMGENEEITDIALRFYTMALERNFTRGRITERVLAACLYIACRSKRKPYLLIEFSNLLKIDVYTLGAVYMQLCKVLYLDQYPFANRLVDPSIFIAKFSGSLPGGRDKRVIQTAVRIITSMKRNWMQTGRKPSGLCGAALYISAISHGLKCSKSDFVRIAHVCDATLTKRLSEFENTDSGSLTIEEFHLKESELDELYEQPNRTVKMDSRDDILCEHKDSGKPFALGLCKFCYDDFVTISGGLHGGSNPPAFQRAEIERRKKESAQENASDSDVDILPCQSLDNSQQSNFERELNGSRASENGRLHSMESVGAPTVDTAVHAGNESCDESDNLSDIDDVEGWLSLRHPKRVCSNKAVAIPSSNQSLGTAKGSLAAQWTSWPYDCWSCPGQASYLAIPIWLMAIYGASTYSSFLTCLGLVDEYLLDEEGKHNKTIIWEALNREYIEEQAAKAARGTECPESQAAAAKKRKERQLARAEEERNFTPAQTAAEAAYRTLTKKRLSSKINFDVLEDMFETSVWLGRTF